MSESDAGISPESPGVILVPPPYSETTQSTQQEIELIDTRQEKLQVGKSNSHFILCLLNLIPLQHFIFSLF